MKKQIVLMTQFTQLILCLVIFSHNYAMHIFIVKHTHDEVILNSSINNMHKMMKYLIKTLRMINYSNFFFTSISVSSLRCSNLFLKMFNFNSFLHKVLYSSYLIKSEATFYCAQNFQLDTDNTVEENVFEYIEHVENINSIPNTRPNKSKNHHHHNQRPTICKSELMKTRTGVANVHLFYLLLQTKKILRWCDLKLKIFPHHSSKYQCYHGFESAYFSSYDVTRFHCDRSLGNLEHSSTSQLEGQNCQMT